MAVFFNPCGGMLSPYLIGTWDLRKKVQCIIQLVNPTAKNLRVWVAFFDDNERPLKCIQDKLSHNDLLEIAVNKYLEAGFGVVKVVSLNAEKDAPEPGVVGYQRHFFTDGSFTESILQPIPMEILKEGEFEIIQKVCRK